jgi:hypothetical protein
VRMEEVWWSVKENVWIFVYDSCCGIYKK